MNINEYMNLLIETLQKFVDRDKLLLGITQCAYDGLFDYRDNCKITRQLNWYARNITVINQVKYLLIPVLFS